MLRCYLSMSEGYNPVSEQFQAPPPQAETPSAATAEKAPTGPTKPHLEPGIQAIVDDFAQKIQQSRAKRDQELDGILETFANLGPSRKSSTSAENHPTAT